MSQVKSSSHSPHCIEHSPYPPCVPTCRIIRDMERVLVREMAKPISLDNMEVDPMYADLFHTPGRLLSPQDSLILAATDPPRTTDTFTVTRGNGDVYAEFTADGELLGGWLHRRVNMLEAQAINLRHAIKATRKDEKRWMKIAIASWLVLVADVTYGIGRYFWGW